MKKYILFLIIACSWSCIHAQPPLLYGVSFEGGTLNGGSIFKIKGDGSDYSSLFSFNIPESPSKDLLRVGTDKIYGLTSGGGPNGCGSIFSVNPITDVYTTLYYFSMPTGAFPCAKLLNGQDGNLYGTTNSGGLNNNGVIFRFDTSGNVYTVLYDFANAAEGGYGGALIQTADGMLWGMRTYGGMNGDGSIFNFDLNSATFSQVFSFDIATGSYPLGNLCVGQNGMLYGLTSGGGTANEGVLFCYDPILSSYFVLHEFDPNIQNDGASPQGSLIADGNMLYGLTMTGGNFWGILFSYNTTLATYNKEYDFDSASGGFCFGDLLKDPNEQQSYIGLANSGGPYNNGVMFKYNVNTHGYSILDSLADLSNGSRPSGTPVFASTNKFFAIGLGGNTNAGVIFDYNSDNEIHSKIHDFENSKGSNPYEGMVQGPDGNFYGVTNSGGLNNYGVLYKYNSYTGSYSSIHNFNPIDGIGNAGKPIIASDGKLYGATNAGGVYNFGVIYSFDLATNIYHVEHQFNDTDGSYPFGDLLQASDGKFYANCGLGGLNQDGVIYSFDPVTHAFIKLFDFNEPNGKYPRGNLIEESPGILYGVTTMGGANSCGVIFRYNLDSLTYTSIHDFSGIDGKRPRPSVVKIPNGKLYGVTSEGGLNNMGVLYSYDPMNDSLLVHFNFDSINGSQPHFNLFLASDGKLYGTTFAGGATNKGVVFCYDPTNSVFTKLTDLSYENGLMGGTFIEPDTILATLFHRIFESDEFVTFPNPTTDQITFSLKCGDFNKIISLEIVNAIGEKTYERSFSEITPGHYLCKLDINIREGIYFARAIGKAKTWNTIFVKK